MTGYVAEPVVLKEVAGVTYTETMRGSLGSGSAPFQLFGASAHMAAVGVSVPNRRRLIPDATCPTAPPFCTAMQSHGLGAVERFEGQVPVVLTRYSGHSADGLPSSSSLRFVPGVGLQSTVLFWLPPVTRIVVRLPDIRFSGLSGIAIGIEPLRPATFRYSTRACVLMYGTRLEGPTNHGRSFSVDFTSTIDAAHGLADVTVRS